MNFYEKTREIREEIKERVRGEFMKIKENRMRNILLQRQETSSFIKGVSSYYICNGLNGSLSHEENLQLASNLEIYSTGLVILDNIIDHHTIRNNKTTFIDEYGIEINTLSSHYAIHIGLLYLMPYIQKFSEIIGDDVVISVGKAIEGMISMDIDKPNTSQLILDSIAKVNGLTLAIPLSLSAVSAITEPSIIYDIIQYGYDTGMSFGLYEELRDIFGEHGRRRFSELRSGRAPFCLVRCMERDRTLDFSEYIGKDMSEKEEEKLIEILKNSGSIDYTAVLVKRHLEYGSSILKKHLNKYEFDIMDSLRITTENELERMLKSE